MCIRDSWSGVIPDSDTRKIIYRRDDRIADGRSPFNTNSKMFCFDDYHEVGFDDLKMRVDNSRFTLFVKDDVYYDHTIDGSESQYPIKSKNGIFSEATYFRVRDRLDIKVDKGFNTPSAIAEQITRQLTETQTPESFEIIEGTEDVVEYNRVITQIVPSNTYKNIECINFFQFDKANFDSFVAVSYTHLRAHETVLDLVCRLLLEKKK